MRHVDPVIEEMRRHGAEIAEECDGDIHRMAERFRREQAANASRLVRRKRRPGEQRQADQPD